MGGEELGKKGIADRDTDRDTDRDRDRVRDRRSGGTDPILSTQRFPRGRDPVGAILKKMAISFKENALRPNVFHLRG